MGRLSVPWRQLPISPAELSIDTTLRCGQSFRWRKFDDVWRCALHGRIMCLRQDADCVYYKAIYPVHHERSATRKTRPRGGTADDTEAFLRSYFNLQLDLRALYDRWSRDDANFRRKAPKFSGIRILNQDAWEALVCFICSSNNNISRISEMAHKLCLHYGTLLGTVDSVPYHDFPTPDALAAPSVEGRLRQLGFGYRAKYIAQTAQAICADKPPGWLMRLRSAECPPWPGMEAGSVGVAASGDGGAGDDGIHNTSTYRAAHEQLLLLSGVGPKVADCVCLMGLGWSEAVPVDTHVWQIAVRDYGFKKAASKTLSKVMYDSVGDHFRSLWGAHAGWAQSVLFTANLKAFSDQLKAKDDEAVAVVETEAVNREQDGEKATAGNVSLKGRKRKTVANAEDAGRVVIEEVKAAGKRRRRI